MTKTITFNELRDIKDRLPDGTIHCIAAELGVSVETVRNYFGGENYKDGKVADYILNQALTGELWF